MNLLDGSLWNLPTDVDRSMTQLFSKKSGMIYVDKHVHIGDSRATIVIRPNPEMID